MPLPKKNILLGGYNFVIHGLSESDPYFKEIGNNPEPEFFELCRRLILDDAVCIDVGANIGLKSLFLARHAMSGRVVSIEASPAVAACLTQNVETNALSNIVIERRAIGDVPGTAKFVDASAYGHLADHGIDVQVTTLAAIIDKLALERVDFIKIDVEGFEWPILRSSMDVFKRFEPLILMEMNSWCLIVNSNISPRDFAAWILENFKYVFQVRKGGTGDTLLDPIAKDELLRLLRQNVMSEGCVTDLLVTNAAYRLKPSPEFLIRQLNEMAAYRDASILERTNLISERDEARRERDALHQSTSWRITAPLRWLVNAIK